MLTDGSGLTKGVFIYDFLAKDAGTYWIHSHDPGQYPKGLRAPFVVRDTQGDNDVLARYEQSYQDEKIVGLSDFWYNFWDAEDQYEGSPVAGDPCAFGVEVVPRAALFNDYLPGVTDHKQTEFEVLQSSTIQPFRTRFRFINMSSFSQFFVLFEQHSVTTVEVDGVLIDPTNQLTEGFTMAPGQRVSVIVKSMVSPGKNPYRILVSLDPSIAPSFPEKNASYCTLPNRATNLTMFTWGCLRYIGVTTEPCSAPPIPGDVAMLTYNYGGSPPLRPWFNKRLHVPWRDHTHTADAFPWNFDERTFRPLEKPGLKTITKDQLLAVQPGNVQWLRIRDMPVELDPKDRGFGTMNTEL